MQDQQTDGGESNGGRKGRVNWKDPSVPCGNSPPLPRWPMALATAAWIAWIGFLLAMTVWVLRSAQA